MNRDGADAVLFYADSSLKAYVGTNGLTCFNIGSTGLYGVVIPLNHLTEPYHAFAGCNVPMPRGMMADGLAEYLAQVA